MAFRCSAANFPLPRFRAVSIGVRSRSGEPSSSSPVFLQFSVHSHFQPRAKWYVFGSLNVCFYGKVFPEVLLSIVIRYRGASKPLLPQEGSSSVLLAVADGVSGGIPSGAAAIIQFYELGTDRPCFASTPSASARRLLIDYDGHKEGGGEDDNEIL